MARWGLVLLVTALASATTFTELDGAVKITYDGNYIQVPKVCEITMTCHPQEERIVHLEAQVARLEAVKSV